MDAGRREPPTPSDGDIRKQNLAAGQRASDWPEFTLRWGTRRGWPRVIGWSLLPGVVIALAGAGGLVWSAGTTSTATTATTAAMAVLLVAGVALTLLVAARRAIRSAAGPDTSGWTLTVGPSSIRLDTESRAGARETQEILRAEAGNLDVAIHRGRGRYLMSATGTSLDYRTQIHIQNRWVADRGPLGLRPGFAVAEVLVSWWPANSLSTAALGKFEGLGIHYWSPEGRALRSKPQARDATGVVAGHEPDAGTPTRDAAGDRPRKGWEASWAGRRTQYLINRERRRS